MGMMAVGILVDSAFQTRPANLAIVSVGLVVRQRIRLGVMVVYVNSVCVRMTILAVLTNGTSNASLYANLCAVAAETGAYLTARAGIVETMAVAGHVGVAQMASGAITEFVKMCPGVVTGFAMTTRTVGLANKIANAQVVRYAGFLENAARGNVWANSAGMMGAAAPVGHASQAWSALPDIASRKGQNVVMAGVMRQRIVRLVLRIACASMVSASMGSVYVTPCV